MSKIKIISNPYKKEIKYQKWGEESDWIDIDYENNRNSKLLSSELTGGFFSFIAKKIVDFLIKEYGCEGEKLEIVFEGTIDEYHELEAVCSDDSYNGCINTFQSGIILENARDILPEVRSLFQKMSPLIAQSVSYDLMKCLERLILLDFSAVR